MYLTKKVYIGAEHKFNKISGNINILKDGKNLEITIKDLSYLEYRIGYWRKANHIHKWFVQNVQDGVDQCQSSYVSINELNELLELCKETLLILNDSELIEKEINNRFSNETTTILVYDCSDLVKEKLPPESGFFFGTYNIDELYKSDIEHTIAILSTLDDSAEYYYEASW
ncbi:MAG: hypothetical protein L3I99_05525 [Sulfurimonas sp.]|nr:hypothetical protein [Sulfurimonas sp.]